MSIVPMPNWGGGVGGREAWRLPVLFGEFGRDVFQGIYLRHYLISPAPHLHECSQCGLAESSEYLKK